MKHETGGLVCITFGSAARACFIHVIHTHMPMAVAVCPKAHGHVPSELYRVLSARINSKRIWIFRSGEGDPIR